MSGENGFALMEEPWKRIEKLERELAETRGWIRKHPPMLDGFYHIAECDCGDCSEWRKAAGLEDEQ